MNSLIVAAVIVVAVSGVAILLRSRRTVDAPTQKTWMVPTQIDPSDLGDSDSDWSIVVFTSGTCHVCADVVNKAEALRSRHVDVVEVEYGINRRTHEKYEIDAVPTLVVCDRSGVVRHSILGPVSATDLWAAVARVRDPNTPTGDCSNH
ncbi:MAG: thioredoxin family protein [Actinomycetota bacterium]